MVPSMALASCHFSRLLFQSQYCHLWSEMLHQRYAGLGNSIISSLAWHSQVPLIFRRFSPFLQTPDWVFKATLGHMKLFLRQFQSMFSHNLQYLWKLHKNETCSWVVAGSQVRMGQALTEPLKFPQKYKSNQQS